MKITQAIEEHLNEFKDFHKEIVMRHTFFVEVLGEQDDFTDDDLIYLYYSEEQKRWRILAEICGALPVGDFIGCYFGDFLDIDCSQDILSQLKTIEHYWEVS